MSLPDGRSAQVPETPQPEPFSGAWESEINPDILRADARWDDDRAMSLAQHALELRERSDRFTATAVAKRRRAIEMEEADRARID